MQPAPMVAVLPWYTVDWYPCACDLLRLCTACGMPSAAICAGYTGGLPDVLNCVPVRVADGDLAWQCEDLLQNRNEWWVPGKIVEVRRRLEHVWRVRHGVRMSLYTLSSQGQGSVDHILGLSTADQ